MCFIKNYSFWGLVVLMLCVLVNAFEPPPLMTPGHVTIGVLAKMRQRSLENDTCIGPVNKLALQEIATLEWALNTINNQSSTEFQIGMNVYDSCGNEDRLIRQISNFIKDNQKSNVPLLGFIALSSSITEAAVKYLHAYSTPIVSTHLPKDNAIAHADNVFTSAPHMYAQIQAALEVLSGRKDYAEMSEDEHRIGVIFDNKQAFKILIDQSKNFGIKINSKMHIVQDGNLNLAEKTVEYIKSQVGFHGTVIALLKLKNINRIVEGISAQFLKRSRTRWIFLILDVDTEVTRLKDENMRENFQGALVIEPYSPLLPGLDVHLENAFQGKASLLSSIIPLLKTHEDHLSTAPFFDTDTSSANKFERPLLSGSRATAIVKAASSLCAAFRMFQIDRCSERTCSPSLIENIKSKDILSALKKLSYIPKGSFSDIRYTSDGRFASSFTVSVVTSFGLQEVGKFKEDSGIILNPSLKGITFQREKFEESRIRFISTEGGSGSFDSRVSNRLGSLPFQYLQNEDQQDRGILKEITWLMTEQDYSSRAWAISVLTLSCVGIISSIYVGIYVSVRFCDGTVAGPQLMGGLLLLGVISVYASCIIHILPPSPTMCLLKNWFPYLPLTLCFSVLLVKAMHLKSLVNLGIGGEVSQINLLISLVFMMGTEVTIAILSRPDWSNSQSERPPIVELDDTGMKHCRQETSTALIAYLLILLSFGVAFGIPNRHICRNHNEGRWLFLLSAVSVPIVLTWVGVSRFAPKCIEPPTTCAASIILATSILAMVYVPKMKIMGNQIENFRHKRLSPTPPLSTIFNQMEPPTEVPHTCGDYRINHKCGNAETTLATCSENPVYHEDIASNDYYPIEITGTKMWRHHLQESPCPHRERVPPPPPPPIRNNRYYAPSPLNYP